MSEPKVPNAPGWWWREEYGDTFAVNAREFGGHFGPRLLVVVDGVGIPVTADGCWIAPVLTVAQAADLAADLIDARETIAALTADLDDARNFRGAVTAETHARAVRSAAAGNRGHDEAAGPPFAVTLAWFTSDARADLLTTLRAAGVPDARAVALVDGGSDV